MKKYPFLLCLITLLCLVSCTVQPPVSGDDTENGTTIQPDQSTTSIMEPTTDPTPDTTEEQTTYGPLHFPEDDQE